MTGFDGYDQWKTASPYDDYDDESCDQCGGKLPDMGDMDMADDSPAWDGFCSVECERGDSVPGGIMCRDLYNTLSHDLGSDPSQWSRELYKETACGASLRFIDLNTISIDSIVEGSDAEVSESITYPFSRAAFWVAVQNVEDKVDEIIQEENRSDGYISGEWK